MGKKRSEPREVPIKFVGQSEEAETEQTGVAPPSARGNGEPPQEEAGGAEAGLELVAAVEAPTTDADTESGLVEPDWQSQLEALNQERATLYDQLLRRQAEFENFRKRTERERADMFQRARAEVMVEMLPVLDNLERALSSLEESNESDADAVRHGVELIHKQFKDALAKLGLQPVEAVGQKFDPNVHEAVASEPSEEHRENTIIEEFQRGYKLGDRLLRPAKVKVASGQDS